MFSELIYIDFYNIAKFQSYSKFVASVLIVSYVLVSLFSQISADKEILKQNFVFNAVPNEYTIAAKYFANEVSSVSLDYSDLEIINEKANIFEFQILRKVTLLILLVLHIFLLRFK